MISVNREINGKWRKYWSTKKNLSTIQRQHRHRVEFYDFEVSDDPYIHGFLPSEREWKQERNNLEKDEQININAVNSKGQYLTVLITKSKEIEAKVNFKIELRLKVSENVYSIKEEYSYPVGQVKPNEYKTGAFCIEILNPLRRLRLKFRGYLRNEDSNELKFVRFRLHWYSISNAFDHKCSFDKQFIARQLVKHDSKSNELEDRIEQFGSIKGTICFENEDEERLYLWGLRSKNFIQKGLQASRIIGIAQDGNSFHVGFVSNSNNGLKYCYGVTKNKKGIIAPITQLSIGENDLSNIPPNAFEFKIASKNNVLTVKIDNEDKNCFRDAFVNTGVAKCINVVDNFNDEENDDLNDDRTQLLAYSVSDNYEKCSDLVLPLTDDRAQNVTISGGKGASLVALTRLSDELENKFIVPKGVIVTTNAYNLLLDENKSVLDKVQNLEKIAWTKSEDLESVCRETEEFISNENIPDKVKLEIENKLIYLYGDALSTKYFAVRSSAVGEDSEEMSGAGQLTTFLGVKGIDEILKAVMKCWGSQFGINYTEYKRGYGQQINDTMAVVILEMVDCDTAGVIFTCDPLNGDERTVVITANYGLGESVVSASSEPDTIRVKVNVSSNDLCVKRTVDEIDKIEIGKKAKFIKMKNDGGTVELDVKKKDECSVSKEDLIKLAEIALIIHAYYGNARDIEWGIKNDSIYMLQSRPVTNLDSYNEWEIMHDLDAGFLEENGFYSRLHWNENFVGSCSPLCVTTIVQSLDNAFQMVGNKMAGNSRRERSNYSPYVRSGLPSFYNQVFMNFRQFFMRMDQSKLDHMAFFGREVNDEEMVSAVREDQRHIKKPSGFKAYMRVIIATALVGTVVEKSEKKFKNNWFPKNKSQSPEQLFSDAARGARAKFETITGIHGMASMSANLLITFILRNLAKSSKSEEDIFADLGVIQAQNTGILSAEVPKLLQDIANSIEDTKSFNDMNDDEALEYLLSGSNPASQKFKAFLERHGYRGMRELDPHALLWADEPIKLVPLIKSTAERGVKEEQRRQLSTSELLASLRCRPSFFQRLQLRAMIPMLHRVTRFRERTKAMIIYYISQYRKAYWSLAHKLSVEQGKLPEAELLFFLTLAEVEQLIKERNSTLVTKAKQKRRVHDKINKYVFPDVVKDWDVTPLNIEKKIDASLLKGSLTVRATAVTPLVTKGRACVAPTLEDAKNIKNGDILITYSTDIGWSPYFPMVSAVVTEMGGLVSHGAVIAREFGLPCLVGVNDACQLFKTGDCVLVDGEKGTLTRIEEESSNGTQ